jgi:hypothetical protein
MMEIDMAGQHTDDAALETDKLLRESHDFTNAGPPRLSSQQSDRRAADSGSSARSSRTSAIGAMAVGALALGALAFGALAIGRLMIGRLAIGRTHLGRVEIDELVVHRQHGARLS